MLVGDTVRYDGPVQSMQDKIGRLMEIRGDNYVVDFTNYKLGCARSSLVKVEENETNENTEAGA